MDGGPELVIGDEEILSESNSGFDSCKTFVRGYLSEIGAEVARQVFTNSPTWGHVMRVIYTAKDGAENPEGGTMICWYDQKNDNLRFSVDSKYGPIDWPKI